MERSVCESIAGGCRIGIMGGTFNPIHYGHLVAAETARVEFALDKVLFIPTGIPPHKVDHQIANSDLRFAMVEISIRDNENFIASRIEIDREGPSYTYDTLKALHLLFPEQELFFITGSDALRDILSWREAEGIIGISKIIGASRPGYEIGGFLGELFDRYPYAQNRIFEMEIPALAISSTDIRKRIWNNKSIRYLLPEEVRRFIIENNIYISK